MKKRLLVIVLATVGILGVSGAASADEDAERERRDWACIFFTDLDQGVCQRNPLPDRLPIPDEVAVPEVPPVAAPDTSSVGAPTVPSAPAL